MCMGSCTYITECTRDVTWSTTTCASCAPVCSIIVLLRYSRFKSSFFDHDGFVIRSSRADCLTLVRFASCFACRAIGVLPPAINVRDTLMSAVVMAPARHLMATALVLVVGSVTSVSTHALRLAMGKSLFVPGMLKVGITLSMCSFSSCSDMDPQILLVIAQYVLHLIFMPAFVQTYFVVLLCVSVTLAGPNPLVAHVL
jgi:hypothetical protein